MHVTIKVYIVCLGFFYLENLLKYVITNLFSAGGRRICRFQTLAGAEVEPNTDLGARELTLQCEETGN